MIAVFFFGEKLRKVRLDYAMSCDIVKKIITFVFEPYLARLRDHFQGDPASAWGIMQYWGIENNCKAIEKSIEPSNQTLQK